MSESYVPGWETEGGGGDNPGAGNAGVWDPATQQMSTTLGTATQQPTQPLNTATQQPAVAPAAAATGTSSLFQPAYLGAPATVNASTIDPTQFSPQATIEQLLTGFAPVEQNAQNQLNQTAADFGVGGGQLTGLETQFQGQEAAGISGAIANAIQNAQANTLGADTSNIGALNTAASTNAGASNATNAYNVGTQNTAQQQQLNDMLNQWMAEFNAANQINTGGQGAGNQSAVNYGNTITTTPNPFTTIFGGLTSAASAAAPFLAAG